MLTARRQKLAQLRRIRLSKLFPPWPAFLSLAFLFLLTGLGVAAAQSSPPSGVAALQQSMQIALDTLWVAFTGCLIFFMNAGFAMLETGFCRQKNGVNVLSKNLIVFALATFAFWLLGFGLMFGEGNLFLGWGGFFLEGADNSPRIGLAYQGVYPALKGVGIPLQAKFFFQLMFAGTAATIISGAVAERIKFFAFFIFSFWLVAVIYPIAGHWIWGGGWLAQLGFWDFAGSTVVHSVGGWAALVGAILLGPRLGKYRGANSLALPGHNLPLSTLGCLILWLGWFGFNGGSTMAADPQAIAHVLLTTNMAAAAGGIAATLMAAWYFGKPDLSLIINGILGGLVAITASCRFVSIGWAGAIGLVAGLMIVFAVDFFDRWQIDDPVGALSVHLVCGIWGTLAVALFALGPNVILNHSWVLYTDGPARGLLLGGGLNALRQLLVQLVGIAAVSLFVTLSSWLTWLLIKTVIGLRVSAEAELKGLDLSEHGMNAYSSFLLKPDSLPTRSTSSFNQES